MDTRSKIILLNGVGSAGKSSIAKTLQRIATAPFLHVAMDAFIDMMPERSFDHPDGLSFETVQQDGKPSVIIHTGPMAARVFRGMRRAIAALAAEGNNLIVDDVLLGEEEKGEYAELLAGFQFFKVGIFAPLEILEERERQRKDRLIGLARWQFDKVHRDMIYDLEVDSSTMTPLDCAELIKAKFKL